MGPLFTTFVYNHLSHFAAFGGDVQAHQRLPPDRPEDAGGGQEGSHRGGVPLLRRRPPGGQPGHVGQGWMEERALGEIGPRSMDIRETVDGWKFRFNLGLVC